MSNIKDLLDFCKTVKNNRDIGSIHRSVVAEVGELSEEVDIALGTSYKQPSEDGVVGEAVDVIIAALDLISVHNPEFTDEQFMEYALKKMNKWKSKAHIEC